MYTKNSGSKQTVEIHLDPEVLRTICHRGRRRLRDIQSCSQAVHQNYTKKYKIILANIKTNIPNIYLNIFKYIQGIQRCTKIYKIPSGRRPGPARPGQARGRPVPVFCISWYILEIFDIFGYI